MTDYSALVERLVRNARGILSLDQDRVEAADAITELSAKYERTESARLGLIEWKEKLEAQLSTLLAERDALRAENERLRAHFEADGKVMEDALDGLQLGRCGIEQLAAERDAARSELATAAAREAELRAAVDRIVQLWDTQYLVGKSDGGRVKHTIGLARAALAKSAPTR